LGTSVPAAGKNFAAALRLRSALAGVGVHRVDGPWTDSEAIVLLGVQAPQSWSTMTDPGVDEQATMSGYLFHERPGDTDDDADDAYDRAGVIFDELADTLHDDPTLGGAVPAFGPPLLTAATWQGWQAETDGSAIVRVRIDWQITWSNDL
jgi:hypothetical protein